MRTKSDNYAQLFLDHFSYQKTRVFTDNSTLSKELDEEAQALRGRLQDMANQDHTLEDVIHRVRQTIIQVRATRDKAVQTTQNDSRLINTTTEPCSSCKHPLTRNYYAVTSTLFGYKPSSFERKTAYAMHQIATSSEEGLLAAIQHAFKAIGFKLGLWTPKSTPQNESIDQFLKWMHGLIPQKTKGITHHQNSLDQCNSIFCKPPINDHSYTDFSYLHCPTTHCTYTSSHCSPHSMC